MSEITVDASKKSGMGRKGKILLGAVAFVLAMTLCGVFISRYTKKIVADTPIQEETTQSAYAVDVPSSPEAALALLRGLLDASRDTSRTYVNVGTELSVDDDTITLNGTAHELKALKYMKNKILGSTLAFYPSHEGTFGDGFDDVPQLTLSPEQISSFECDFDGEGSDIILMTLGVSGNAFAQDDSPARVLFRTKEDSKVFEKLKGEMSPVLDCTGSTASCAALSLEARINAVSGALESVMLVRKYDVNLTMLFKGALETAGEKSAGFTCTARESFAFTNAGISFEKDTITMRPGDEDTLAVSAVVAEDATKDTYKISFKSSDETVVTVDGEGNVKCLASAQPASVTVTVTFEYLGNIYTDKCVIDAGQQ